MISAALLAISALTSPTAVCSPLALSCAVPAATYADRPILRAKGVAGSQVRRGAGADHVAVMTCHPHPTKNPTCRHRQAQARSENKRSALALEGAQEVRAQ
jgi:hypothetical protein